MSDQLVTAEDLLAKMRAGTKEVYEIQMRALTIPVRMLSLDERLAIRNRAMIETKKIGGDDTYMASIVQKQTLLLAGSLNNGEVGVLSERLMGMLTLDEVLFLYAEYDKICQDVNPGLDQISPEQFKLLVDTVKKNPDSVLATDCSLQLLRSVFSHWKELILKLDTQA